VRTTQASQILFLEVAIDPPAVMWFE